MDDAGSENQNAGESGFELEREFRPEIEGAAEGDSGAFRLESVYSRTGYISGTPLRDGFHFAQTQINDFGRPYGEGWNNVNRFFDVCHRRPLGGLIFVANGRDSAGLPALPLAARETIQQVDHLPLSPPGTASLR